MSKPRALRLPGEGRKFGSMRILEDGRVRFSPWTMPGLQPLVVFANYRGLDLDGRDREDTSTYSISLAWGGETIFGVHVTRHRVVSTQFTYNLSPEKLREAVSTIRYMKNGLEKWIIPGLARMEWGLLHKEQTPQVKALLATIPELLRSNRSLPISKLWREEQLRWERWKRERKKKR